MAVTEMQRRQTIPATAAVTQWLYGREMRSPFTALSPPVCLPSLQYLCLLALCQLVQNYYYNDIDNVDVYLLWHVCCLHVKDQADMPYKIASVTDDEIRVKRVRCG